jgi:hypothetical protein
MVTYRRERKRRGLRPRRRHFSTGSEFLYHVFPCIMMSSAAIATSQVQALAFGRQRSETAWLRSVRSPYRSVLSGLKVDP